MALYSHLSTQAFSYIHWAEVTSITSTLVLAKGYVFGKQSNLTILCLTFVNSLLRTYWVILSSSLKTFMHWPLYTLLMHWCQIGTVSVKELFPDSLSLIPLYIPFQVLLRSSFFIALHLRSNLFLVFLVTHVCIVTFDLLLSLSIH